MSKHNSKTGVSPESRYPWKGFDVPGLEIEPGRTSISRTNMEHDSSRLLIFHNTSAGYRDILATGILSSNIASNAVHSCWAHSKFECQIPQIISGNENEVCLFVCLVSCGFVWLKSTFWCTFYVVQSLQGKMYQPRRDSHSVASGSC